MAETATFEQLEQTLKGYKEATDKAVEEVREQLRTSQATEGALKKMEEDFNKKLEDVNKYAEALEKQMKDAKGLTKEEQRHFNDLLGASIEKNWSEIEKFKNKDKDRKLKLDLLEDNKVKVMTITGNVTNAGAYFTTVQVPIRTLPNRKVHMR